LALFRNFFKQTPQPTFADNFPRLMHTGTMHGPDQNSIRTGFENPQIDSQCKKIGKPKSEIVSHFSK
jgi:hypothetical protein